VINTRGVCVLALTALVIGCGGHSPSKRHSAQATAPVSSNQTTYALGTARAEHESILLPTGEVFVVGGVDSRGQVLDSTEIVSETGVRPGPTLSMPRTGHTLTILPDGKVLIAGGLSSLDGPPTQETEIFDPEFGDLNEGPQLADARAYHTTFYVGDALIVAGGQGATAAVAGPTPTTPPPGSASGLLDTMERVDVPNRVAEILPVFLSMPQKGLVGVAISPLQFVFVGGQTETGPAPAEIFDGTGLVPLAGMPPRTGAAIVTNNSSVVVLGGESEGVLRDDLEVFDGFSFQPQAMGLHPRQGAVAAVSSAGILIVGGVDAVGPSEVVELVLPSQVVQLSPLELPRHAHTFTLGADQQVGFVIGGYDSERVPTDSIELVQVPGLDYVGTLTGNRDGTLPTGTTTPAGRLDAAVDAKTLAGMLRAASGADCNSKAHKAKGAKPAAPGKQSARLSAAGTARLAILIADVAEPSDADLLAQPAQPKAAELIDRLERALTALGASNARELATETRTQLQSLCAVKFPGKSLKSFLKHYKGKAHPAKALLKARIRIYKGLDAAAAAPALDTIMGQAADADLKSLDDGQLTAEEALSRVRTTIMAKAAAKAADVRAKNAFTILGQVLEFDALSAPTTLANPSTTGIQAP
jgi:galactose oxidase-like protein